MGRPNLNYWHCEALYDETLSDSSLARTGDRECDVVAIRAVRPAKLRVAGMNSQGIQLPGERSSAPEDSLFEPVPIIRRSTISAPTDV